MTKTLIEARKELFDRLADGEAFNCPCCDRHVKVYRWSLYSTAIQLLAKLYLLGGTEKFIESKIAKKGLRPNVTPSELCHWGLVEQDSTPRKDGGRSGWWRVTKLGEEFLRGETTIPKYVYVYDGQIVKFDGPDVSIGDCDKTFNYREHLSA